MTTKPFHSYVVLTLLLIPAFAMTCDALSVFLKRPLALLAVQKTGPQCMALVDPTAPVSPQLRGFDPETAEDLTRANSTAAAFMHSHPMVSVTVLDGPTYLKCFGVSNSNNQAGTDAIFLNSERLPSPTLRAVAVAHELVHVEHSHKDTPQGQHNVFRHLFVSEEGEAHLSDQEAAKALHTHSLDSPVETYELVEIALNEASFLLFCR